MRKTKETQKGITLISVVITIIVLLILAGISVAALTGNNGILTQANQAKDDSNIAEIREKIEVEALRCIDKRGNFNKGTFKTNVEKNLKGSKVSDSGNTIIVKLDGYKVTIDGTTGDIIGDPKKIILVKPGVTVSETEKDNYTDGVDSATVPAGFEVDETENTISKGLVVHGPDKTNGDNGSEFVWVPVPDINNMAQCSTAGGDCNLQLDGETLKCITHNSTEIVGKIYAVVTGNSFGTVNTTYTVGGLREPAIVTGNNSETGTDSDNNSEYNNNLFTLESLKTDYKNMATSVAKYGGFYVGRYEMSLSDATESSVGTTGTAQSKQGVIPSSSSDDGTLMWYGLYSKQNKTYKGINNSVESSMIWGSQYDRILNWALEGEDKEKVTKGSIGGNNGEQVVTITGNSKYSNDSINNIRDLSGNLREWTLEAFSNNNRICRGGYYCLGLAPTWCANNIPRDKFKDRGSRLTLYVI